MRTVRFLGLIAAVAASSISCGDVVRQGRSPVILVIDSLTATAGGGSASSSSHLLSDVVRLNTTSAGCTVQSPCPTIFNDSGSASFHLSLKDIGTPQTPAQPSANNDVTITRVHIKYVRADGRNTQGVDVPYEFDAAATVTIPANGTATLGFEIVRHVAKEESPLVQLATSASIINTITEVTFYGSDLVGNQVSATGKIQIDFGNFGDTQ
jgi:hypothetical protein